MFFRWVKRSFTRGKAVTTHSLHSQQELKLLLRRERLRCDRTGGAFTLVSVSLARTTHLDRDLLRLSSVLLARLRATDDAGLLGPESVGILLPDTDAAGAWTLVENLGSRLADEGVSARFDVEVYPVDNSQTPPGEELPADEILEEAEGPTVPAGAPSPLLMNRLVLPMPWWKRTIDVLGAVLGLILLAPIFVAGALAVRLSGPGAILYKQRRAGIGGKPFTIYKFRSMIANADAVKDLIRNKNEQDGPAFKIEKDPRVTRVGRFLRSTSIDELPQLWNVLRGDMSLVGPRPLPVDESTACQRWQRRRLDVAPGITCRWQVEDRRIKIPFDAWMRLDLSYIESRSLRHDLKLILRTLRAVFFRR